MSPARGVLVYPAGTEIGLEIGRSLAFSKHFEAIGVNSVADHSEMVFRRLALGAPRADDPALAGYLLGLARDLEAELVVPAHDEAMLAVAGLRRHGLKVVGPSEGLARVLRLKSATYDALEGEDFLPRRYGPGDLHAARYPLFGRPDRGQGSVGARLLRTEQDARDYLGQAPGVVTEHLPGSEYTVDCYTDAGGRLLWLTARERVRIRSGICVRVAEAPPGEFLPLAERLNARLAPRGPWFFQLKRDASGAPRLMEAANRVAGTMGYDRLRGANLVEMALFEALGLPVAAPALNPAPPFTYDRALDARVRWLDGRLPEAVFVDFDDTILLAGGRLNHELVGVLYGLKCSLDVPIVLVTRHAGDLPGALERLGIAGLFARVEHLDARQPKAERIPERGFCVLVDDSFAERQAVALARPQVLCLGPEAASFLAGALNPG